MADSIYKILEYRVVEKTDDEGNDNVWAYICISDPTDFLPVGGWYGAKVPADTTSMEFLSAALLTQAFLTKWERIAPDEINQAMQERYAAMLDHVEYMVQREAANMMREQGGKP